MNTPQQDQFNIGVAAGLDLFRDKKVRPSMANLDGLFLLKQMLLGIESGTLVVVDMSKVKKPVEGKGEGEGEEE